VVPLAAIIIKLFWLSHERFSSPTGLSPNDSPSLDLIPRLKREVVRQNDDVIEFRNGGSLEIATNNAALVFGSEPAAAHTLWLETDPLPKTEGIDINHKPKPASHDLAQANRGE
jgi:hypothetical protein